MATETDSPITIEIADDGNGTVIESGTAAQQAATVISDDPAVGVEDLKRQVQQSRASEEEANRRAANAAGVAADAERRVAAANEETRRVSVIAGDSQYNSIVNGLAASEREMEQLQSLKATALEKGEYTDVTKLDGQMGKLAARIHTLETGKDEADAARKASPAPVQQQQPTLSREQQNEQWLSTIPARSAAWIRQQPRFFTDPAFQAKVLAAANYAESVKGISNTSDDYFRFIEGETGITQPVAVTHAQPLSAAAAPVQSRESPAPAPAPRAAAQIAAAPSRSLPEGHQSPMSQTSVTLSADERAMAKQMFPRRTPTDPDPDVVYARNKLALIREGRIGG